MLVIAVRGIGQKNNVISSTSPRLEKKIVSFKSRRHEEDDHSLISMYKGRSRKYKVPRVGANRSC
jgi:hypothetical protein